MGLDTLSLWIDEVQSDHTYFVYYDSQAGESNGYLRSYPLLASVMGTKLFSLISEFAGKNCRRPVNLLSNPNTHSMVIGDDLYLDEISIIHVEPRLDQETGYVTKYLETNVPRIFLTGNPEYMPARWMESGRTLLDRCPYQIQKYETYYADYLEKKDLTAYQLEETKNIIFLHLAKINSQLTGKRKNHLTDLFDYEDPNLAPSPIWDIAVRVLMLKNENYVQNIEIFIFNAMRPWIEKNMYIDSVSTKIFSLIKEGKYSVKGIQTLREQKLQEGDYAQNLPILDIPSFLIKPKLGSAT